ncbi:MAG TPA: N-terminal phage integrase SAM-like domain-containing protein [Acidimicrobiales bacterium]|nr:N-terminal phage integrase SAM-like domain-containing protein [Acidimicrobiales bacterium]
MYLGRDEKGRKRYLTRTIHGNKRFAEDMLPEVLMEAGRSDVVAEGTLSDLVQRWEAVADANLAPTTLREYRRLLDRLILPRFGHIKVRNLRPADIDAFYADLQRRGAGKGGAPRCAKHPPCPLTATPASQPGREVGVDHDESSGPSLATSRPTSRHPYPSR